MNRVKSKTRSVKRTSTTSKKAVVRNVSTLSTAALTSVASPRTGASPASQSAVFNRSMVTSSKSRQTVSAVASRSRLNVSNPVSEPVALFSTSTAPSRLVRSTFSPEPTQISAPVVNAPSASIHTAATKKAVAPVSMMMKQPSAAPAAVAPAVPVVMAPNRGFMTPAFFYNMHTNHMKKWLTARGLYIEDTYYNNEICKLAVNELPADVRNDRLRRLKRAIDLDLKMKTLPADLQNYDPFVSYGLDDTMGRIEAVIAERYNYI